MEMIVNYKELCYLFDEPPKTNGDSKATQLKRFQRRFSVQKMPNHNKYIIDTEVNNIQFTDKNGSNNKEEKRGIKP